MKQEYTHTVSAPVRLSADPSPPCSLIQLLCSRISPEKQRCCLGQRPFEMGVADLGASGASEFAGRAVLAFNQASVGGEFLDAREAIDVMDLIVDDQRQNLSDAGHASEN